MTSLGPEGSNPRSSSAIKSSLRAALRQQRKSIPFNQRRRAARRAARVALGVIVRLQARRVAVYLAMGSELSTAPLIAHLKRRGIVVFAPVLQRKNLRFAPLGPHTRRHALGMAEPLAHRALRADAMDVMVMPLLGFDADGHRLGQGGGWYDRTLSRCRFRPYRLGFAFAAQQVECIPAEAWDVRLQAVATERRVHRFPRPLH
jgi:5-formyltetrahydrofolate cyclo-ligase